MAKAPTLSSSLLKHRTQTKVELDFIQTVFILRCPKPTAWLRGLWWQCPPLRIYLRSCQAGKGEWSSWAAVFIIIASRIPTITFSKNMSPEQNIPKFTTATSLYINVFCENLPQYPKWPVYRVMDPDGGLRPGAVDPELDEETVQKMYATMVRLQAMDQIFYNAQRQGRISFYMTNSGEVSWALLQH